MEAFTMEIGGKIPPIKIDAYINNAKENNKITGALSKSGKPGPNLDKVEFSQTARDVKEAREQLDSIPDVREEKVKEVKAQIQEGTYKVDGKKIAFNMIRDSLIDEIV
jgi:negative regulator of flagellin synthesis FlgM